MSDPYNRQFVTAGDPYVVADGRSIAVGRGLPGGDNTVLAEYNAKYGVTDGAIVWAEEQNQGLLNIGQAILTPQGVMSVDNARFALNKAGYNGPLDPGSVASHYQMLATPTPPTPAPQQTAHASASLGNLGLSGGISGLPRPLIYAGLALVAYEMFFKRGHR